MIYFGLLSSSFWEVSLCLNKLKNNSNSTLKSNDNNVFNDQLTLQTHQGFNLTLMIMISGAVCLLGALLDPSYYYLSGKLHVGTQETLSKDLLVTFSHVNCAKKVWAQVAHRLVSYTSISMKNSE